MITEHEMQISNMSYTEKDFASIYPALLDLVKQLTNRWDPSISNESDPGNVLLKLLAAIGDKNNYNIDKNVLECFMPSATQETSMRMLTEAVGYNMRYYQSATTLINFKYTKDLPTQTTFNKFSTVITNQDSSIAYTMIEDVTLTHKNSAISGMAIEGQLTDLVAGDNNIIKLSNLDDNNRLYFPEIFVAENGVFITNDGAANFEEWKRVDNLNTQKPLTRCYKFGFDSKAELPYLEFPSDIAQLLGSGIRVSYIITHGDAGNVSAAVLDTVASSNVSTLDLDSLVVYNPSSSVNGKTKETIDEAYNNFKKIIGTFDTLVTTRDYANAMYNLVDEYNRPLVSNAMASDRTDDINYGLKVVTYDNQGQYVEVIPNDELSVADLVLYPLQPYKGENYNVNNPNYVYDESYQPLKQYKQINTTDYMVDDEVLVSDLEDLKCIGHTFKDLPFTYNDDTDKELIYNFRNIANLDVQIFTYAKVNTIAQAEIKSNILRALSDNFNARQVEYGYEIPYDRLLEVIYGADSRIKLVNLGEPEYRTDILYVDGTSESVFDSDGEAMTDVVAKNVLAGKLSLFLYDDRFDWQFGQTDVSTYDNINALSTVLGLPVSPNTSGGNFDYTLKENEVIQFITPTLNTTTIYPAGVYYRFTNASYSDGVIIPAGADYKLSSTDQLKLYYVDSNEVTRNITIPSGTIIRPNFDMRYTTVGDATIMQSGSEVPYDKINTNKNLEIREFVTVKLDNIGTPIYWIRNNANNVLFNSQDGVGDQTVILDAGEYFIYSNSNFDDLVVLGAGTSITRTGYSDQWAIPDAISAESINLSGVDAFKSSDWQYKQLTNNKYLTLQEMQIVTVGADTEVVINPGAGGTLPSSFDGSWYTLDLVGTGASITLNSSDGSSESLPISENSELAWKIRTRLDINAGPNTPQILLKDTNHTQAIVFTTTNSATSTTIEGTADGDKCILFNYPVMMAGGNNIDMKVTNILLGTSSYALSLCEYTKVGITATPEELEQTIDPTAVINLAIEEDTTLVLPLNIDYIETEQPSQDAMDNQGANYTYNYQPFGTYIVPILFTQGSSDTSDLTTVEITSNCADIYEYNVFDGSGNKVPVSEITNGGLYNLELVAKWQGEYDTLSDLQTQRPAYSPVTLSEQPDGWPDVRNIAGDIIGYYTNTSGTRATTFVAGTTYYVKPNVDGDICKVGDTLYSWDATNDQWVTTGNTVNDFNITFEITVTTSASATESFLSIGKIHRVLDLNQAISQSMQANLVLDRIRELTDGITNEDGVPVKFFYTYEPSNTDVIETDSMVAPEAFWDVNNIANKFTIPKLDLENSKIYVAKASQL